MQNEKFYQDLERTLVDQYEKFPYYRALCSRHDLGKNDISRIISSRECYRLPSVPALSFKKSKGLIPQLNLLDRKDGTFVISSSTYGDPSYIYCDKAGLAEIRSNYSGDYPQLKAPVSLSFCPPPKILYKASAKKALFDKKALLRMLTTYEGVSQSYDLTDVCTLDILSYIRSQLDKSKKPRFVGMPKKRFLTVLQNVIKDKKELVIAGITLLMYPTLMEYFGTSMFDLGERTHIVTSGGGWSGKKGTIETRELRKHDFITNLARIFSIPNTLLSSRFSDVYAFCESPASHKGFWSPELDDFLYTPHARCIAYAVDPDTKQIVGEGRRGLFHVLTPHGCNYAANASILQGDLVTVRETNEDGSIRTFSHISRFPGLEIEGCAYESKGLVKDLALR